MPFLKLINHGGTEPTLVNAAHIASVQKQSDSIALLIMADGSRTYADHTFAEVEQALAAMPDVEIRTFKPAHGTGVPQAVHDALRHVQQFHPEVVQVFFGIGQRWRYLDEDFNAPDFDGHPVDIGILEDAADSVPYLPFAASLPCPSSD